MQEQAPIIAALAERSTPSTCELVSFLEMVTPCIQRVTIYGRYAIMCVGSKQESRLAGGIVSLG
jgi:hypothetical protein